MGIGNLIGKKGEKASPDKDAEVQRLREKFNEIVKSDLKPDQTPVQQKPAEQFQYVEPERAADNERITNLIMQQIKELIEIDNNLNTKLKELESKLGEQGSTITSTKTVVEQFDRRLELIEKNMEKFMGLYEIVTNRFNPFVNEEEKPIKHDTVVEDRISPEPEVAKEVNEIFTGTGLQAKLDGEQQQIVKSELGKAIELIGPQTAEQLRQELAGQLTQTVAQQLQHAMAQHMRVSNDELKNTLKEMLIETVSHLKQGSQQPKKQAAYLDKEVHPDFHFYLPDGTPIKSLKGLRDALRSMDDKTFRTHVTERKNDFAEWIRVVLRKNSLADRVAGNKTKQGILKVLDSL